MTNKALSNSKAAQRFALLEHLKKHGFITTLQLRLLWPPGAIRELIGGKGGNHD